MNDLIHTYCDKSLNMIKYHQSITISLQKIKLTNQLN